MEETLKELANWLDKLYNFEVPNWDKLPDLDLYMDQVITYLERELRPLTIADEENIVTTWMINNYVKGDLLPRPNQKKYSKEHLAYIIIICSLKQILSISDIKNLFDFEKEKNENLQSFYDFFRTKQVDIIRKITADTIKETKEISDDLNVLYNHITKLALEAEIKKIIANKILFILSNHD
ncbi:MAG TPA: DUF1836 domain-containing protein, partial [Bacilli bacterium]